MSTAEELHAARVDHEPPFGADLVRHYLRDLVYGANDGIITTFAVVSGVAGAALSPRTALILGLANLFADGFSMGASTFLAIRSSESVRCALGQPIQEPYPARHSLATFVSFLLVGSVPLVVILVASPAVRFPASAVFTLATLFVVGAFRAFVTEMRWWRAGAEMLAVGAVAAAVSYLVGEIAAVLV